MLNAHNDILGPGAQAYLKQFFERGMTREEVRLVVQRVESIAMQDKRVKKCNFCGGYWHDDSLRNTKKTCSDECKTGIKTLQRRKQRERQELIAPKPKKRTLADDYVYWLEYPYWINEYSMLKVGWKYEVPHRAKTLDFIKSQRAVMGYGNRKIKVARAAE